MIYRNILGSAAIVLGALGPAHAADDTLTSWRVFVGDHEAAQVTALDLGTDAVLATFELASPATLYATSSQEAVFAVQAEGDRVSLISTGLQFDDHGDHGDLRVESPRLGSSIAGDRPVHFVEHDGEIALFFDGEGRAAVIAEAEWLEGGAPAVEIAAASPHHGVAIPMGGPVLMSAPHATDASALPIGIDIVGRDGAKMSETTSCPDLHGEATSGRLTAIACAEGVLVARMQAGKVQVERIDYPPELPAGKITTLLGGVGMQYFLGNYGASAVVIFEPGVDPEFRLVELPARRVHFVLDPARPRAAYVLTEDGALHEVDVVSAKVTRSVQLTAPYSMDGGFALPRPRLAVAGAELLVSDPLEGVVRVVSTDSFAELREIEVPGRPFAIVAVGGSGRAH